MRCLGVLLFCFCVSLLFGDVIYLKNGRKIEGKVVKVQGEYIEVKVPFGRLWLRKEEVARIEKRSDEKIGLRQAKYLRKILALEDSLRLFRKLFKKNPQDKELREELAKTYHLIIEDALRQKDISRARKYCLEGRQLLPESELLKKDEERIQKLYSHLLSLLKVGKKLFEEKKYLECLKVYKEVLSYLPGHLSKIAPFIAVCHLRLGETFLAKRKYLKALEHLEQALTFYPNRAWYVENLLVYSILGHCQRLFRRREFQKALSFLQKGLHYSPGNRKLLFLKGLAYHHLGDFKKASWFYARVLGIPLPSGKFSLAELQEKAAEAARIRLASPAQEKAWQAKIEGKDWLLIQTPHFRIYHRNRFVGKRAAEVLEHFYNFWKKKIKLLQGKDFPIPCSVYIFPSREKFLEATRRSWQSGMSVYRKRRGRVVVLKILTYQQAPSLFKSVLPHELGHLFLALLVDFEFLPLWFQEGFAIQFEYSFRKNFYAWKIKEALDTQSAFSVSRLLLSMRYPKEKREAEIFYAQSYSLVSFLLHKGGWEKLLRFASEMQSRGVERALLDSYRYRDLKSFEREWEYFVRKQ